MATRHLEHQCGDNNIKWIWSKQVVMCAGLKWLHPWNYSPSPRCWQTQTLQVPWGSQTARWGIPEMAILQSVRCRVDWGWSTHSLAKQCNNNMLHTNTITDVIWHFVLHVKQWTTLITKETVVFLQYIHFGRKNWKEILSLQGQWTEGSFKGTQI